MFKCLQLTICCFVPAFLRTVRESFTVMQLCKLQQTSYVIFQVLLSIGNWDSDKVSRQKFFILNLEYDQSSDILSTLYQLCNFTIFFSLFSGNSNRKKTLISDFIFNSTDHNLNAGRPSLLDKFPNSDSIIINDLTESDSGSYQLTVDSSGYNVWKPYKCTFSIRANVTVRGTNSMCMFQYDAFSILFNKN